MFEYFRIGMTNLLTKPATISTIKWCSCKALSKLISLAWNLWEQIFHLCIWLIEFSTTTLYLLNSLLKFSSSLEFGCCVCINIDNWSNPLNPWSAAIFSWAESKHFRLFSAKLAKLMSLLEPGYDLEINQIVPSFETPINFVKVWYDFFPLNVAFLISLLEHEFISCSILSIINI